MMRTSAPRQNQAAAPRSLHVTRPGPASPGPKRTTETGPGVGQSLVPDRSATRFAHDFSRVPLHPAPAPDSRPLLPITAPGDPVEREADRLATQALRAPVPGPQEAPRCEGAGALPGVERPHSTVERATGPHDVTGKRGPIQAPPMAETVFREAGQPLDPATRAFMEPRFGRDFGAVRLHTHAGAAHTARALNADAFTIGSHIAFAAGRYAPASQAGRDLIAHELAHVVQQARGPHIVARRTTEQYQTKGVDIDPTALDTRAEMGYWEQRIRSRFQMAVEPNTESRWRRDAEERDAVLSVVFQMLPQTAVTRDTTHIITVPKRATARTSANLAYQVTLHPPGGPGGHPVVEILFVTEGNGAAAVSPEAPSTSFTPKPVGYRHSGFPQQDADRFWQTHGEEQRRVFKWIESESPRSKFNQVLTTTVTSGGATRSFTFAVSGTKDPSSGNIPDLQIVLLGAVAPSSKTPSTGYAAHDFADADLEDARRATDAAHPDRIGAIQGLAALPRGEQPSVKYAIVQHFRNGTRNAEVDAIVPIVEGSLFDEVTNLQRLSPTARDTAGDFARLGVRVAAPRRVLYTFRFRPAAADPHTQDVEIQRIGEEGKEAPLRRLGALARVNGYSDVTQGKEPGDVKALKDWLKGRYHGVTPAGSTIGEIEKDVDEQIRKGSGAIDWFEKNYGIKILNRTDADKRLVSIGLKEADDRAGLDAFSPTDLQTLELILETMGDKVVQTFKGVQMIRQHVYNKWDKATRSFIPQPSVAGITIQPGSTRTIIIFDAAYVNVDSLFLGSAQGVLPADALPVAHEFGHTIAARPGVQKAFDRLVAAKNIRPITWYAGQDPPKELLPEAFGLFYTDPEWLQQNWPDLFDFFQTLDRTGKPP